MVAEGVEDAGTLAALTDPRSDPSRAPTWARRFPPAEFAAWAAHHAPPALAAVA